MKDICYFLLVYLIKVTILTRCQSKHLIKKKSIKGPSKWLGLNQINYIDLTLARARTRLPT